MNLDVIFKNPLFGIALSIAAFAVGAFVNRKLKTPVANPLLIATVLIIALLKLTGISYEDFFIGGHVIHMLLPPATAVLALTVYNQMELLKKNLLPVLVGSAVGAVAAVSSIWIMCKVFGLDDSMTMSLLPKSVTTAISVSISESHGGIVPITVAAVVVTGIFGAVAAPLFIRLFRVRNPLAAGVAIGSCSHAAGTSRAIELGELQGAASSISLGMTGLVTALISLFWK